MICLFRLGLIIQGSQLLNFSDVRAMFQDQHSPPSGPDVSDHTDLGAWGSGADLCALTSYE